MDKEVIEMGSQVNRVTVVILKAIALAMSVAVIVLVIMGATTVETSITLLGIGLFAMALSAFTGVKEAD
jgi:hypothetical protein